MNQFSLPSSNIGYLQILKQAEQQLQTGYDFINRTYLSHLNKLEVHSATQVLQDFKLNNDVRIYRLERIVNENKQSVLESAVAAYTALGALHYAVFLLLDSDGAQTDVYLGVRGNSGQYEVNSAGKLLQAVFDGHFSGSKLSQQGALSANHLQEKIKNWGHNNDGARVTAVTCVPSLSIEEREHFVQGLERFIDAAENHSYQALILADPVSPIMLDTVRQGYENLATQIFPLMKQQLSFGAQESKSVAIGFGVNISKSMGECLAETETQGYSYTEGTSKTTTEGISESESSSAKIPKLLKLYPGGQILEAFFAGNQKTKGISSSISSGTSESKSQSVSSTTSKTTSTTKNQGWTENYTDTGTLGSTRQVSMESIDKSIEQMLKKIDHNLQRIEEAKAYGGWKTAAYFMANEQATSEALASIFLGLMRGSKSSSEDFALNTWKGQKKTEVLAWLSAFTHPHLQLDSAVPVEYITPATLVSGREMAIQLSLPRRSTSTVSVIETQAFGRQIQYLDDREKDSQNTRLLTLGKIRHLWENLPQKIQLDLDQLSSHAFVTGSTGAGKSNTLYQIIAEADRHHVPFLVIEPAKGEYKHVFGHRNDVRVLGSNPACSELLRINPFAFPENIHVLEHVDRLVEIFNVCWPMYAAMPAVLKEATLRAYQKCGWDLGFSRNCHTSQTFPMFVDLLEALEQVLESSEYSAEVKGNYIGSLATRIKSLTNGLNGQIFNADEIPAEELFDRNVIVDLSRIGSSETKSLIMGILVMRLTEHRMANPVTNAPLRHLTVLEEAHHILRCSSSAKNGPEGANMAGKSVEMLSNAIAEMRTYGEGFVIVDQSPSAVDMAAIRNTNTKIIMRLPEESDRRLAGKAAALSDEQLEEISRLPQGVAIVHQNNWLEPVLCQVDKHVSDSQPYQYDSDINTFNKHKLALENLLTFLLDSHVPSKRTHDVKYLEKTLKGMSLPWDSRHAIQGLLRQYSIDGKESRLPEEDFTQRARLVVDVLDKREHLKNILNSKGANFAILHQHLLGFIMDLLPGASLELCEAVEQCVMRDFFPKAVQDLGLVYEKWLEFMTKQG